jgi:hypothetical protein
MIVNTLDRNPRLIGNGGNAAGIGEYTGECFACTQFIDGWAPRASGDGNLRSRWRNKDNIAGEKLYIVRLVSMDEERVEVEFSNRLIAPAQFDLPQ